MQASITPWGPSKENCPGSLSPDNYALWDKRVCGEYVLEQYYYFGRILPIYQWYDTNVNLYIILWHFSHTFARGSSNLEFVF